MGTSTYTPARFRVAAGVQSLLFQFGPKSDLYANAPPKAAPIQFDEIPRGVATPAQMAAAGRSEKLAEKLQELEDDIRMSPVMAKGLLIEVTGNEPAEKAEKPIPYAPPAGEPGATGVEGIGDPAHPMTGPGGSIAPAPTPDGPSEGNPPGLISIDPSTDSTAASEPADLSKPPILDDGPDDAAAKNTLSVTTQAEAAGLLVERGVDDKDLRGDSGKYTWGAIEAAAAKLGLTIDR